MAAAADAIPPPLTDIPTAKQKKYDRQLRLWAASGQQALEDAHILLINSGPGATGVEALKNLILPGVGKYTILDSAIVAEADLGVNFFLDDTTLGASRAEHTCKLLQELNPDVVGHFITEVTDSPALLNMSADSLCPARRLVHPDRRRPAPLHPRPCCGTYQL